MHLYRADGSDGGISTVRMFSLISVLILVIACINNVNLSTARSMLRSKEVSLRKIVGAGKGQLFLQFIVETALLFGLAAFLSLGLMKVLMPLFNDISGKSLALDLTDYHVWLVIGLTVLATLMVSSIYPALLLSSFKPLEAMKGKVTAGVGNARFRRVLVVVQFVFSVVLIVGTLVIGRQLDYIRSRQLGYDKDHVISFYMRRGMGDHYDAVREALLRQPGVLGVARGNSNIVRLGPQTGDNDWDGKAPGQTMMVHPVAIDKDFFSFFKMQLVEGDNFRGDATDSVHFILNETAARELGIKDPIGRRFRMWKANGTIIGVAKDFHFASLREKIGPAVFYYKPADSRLLYLRTSGRDAGQAIAAAKAEWKKYNTGYPFKYTFLDDDFRSLYQSEERTAMLFRIFSAIAILISCLGLFGLSAYTAQVRTREIGVRKVLGADVPDIIRLLGVGFIRLVLMGILIAVPLSWFVMHRWLQDFAYKIELSWTLFALAGLIAVGVALATISFQSIRAALANPVKCLRTQ
jgi:putative ABC transport system permease protein